MNRYQPRQSPRQNVPLTLPRMLLKIVKWTLLAPVLLFLLMVTG